MKQTLLNGLFPAVRAQVLRLLFTNPGQELYTRELARLSFLALRTVQDELAKLESANLVVSRAMVTGDSIGPEAPAVSTLDADRPENGGAREALSARSPEPPSCGREETRCLTFTASAEEEPSKRDIDSNA